MGALQTNPPTLPNTVSDSWQPLVERDALSYYGMNKVTLTNWDETTTIPQVAQGSVIDINGSLATFAIDEAIGGSPADGTVYLKFVVSGSTVTPEFTATAPTWYADKQGWYNASGERYSGHNCLKAGTSYTNKSRFMDEKTGDSRQLLSDGTTYAEAVYTELIPSGVKTDNAFVRFKTFTFAPPSSGGSTSFAHGIDYDKVLTTFIMFKDSTPQWYPASGLYTDTIQITVNATNIVVSATTTILQGKTCKLLLTYEA